MKKKGAKTEQAEDKRQRPEQREKAAREFRAGVERHADDHVAQGDAEEEGRNGAPPDEGRFPELSSGRIMRPELERDRPQDEGEKDEHQGQVETAEDRRVGHREGGEQGAAPGEEPDFVAVPDRAHGPYERPLLVLVSRQEREKRPDAEVEAVENGIAGKENADEREPDVAEQVPGRHQTSPRAASTAGSPGPPRIVRRMTDNPAMPMRA